LLQNYQKFCSKCTWWLRHDAMLITALTINRSHCTAITHYVFSAHQSAVLLSAIFSVKYLIPLIIFNTYLIMKLLELSD